eukprot:TRINITY_DN27110_c0_g1_i1.p1 TRINITY_DN27110_c0_g1~~TRINITY_DN27110_c0_g1_i1.p1  ORF type:complete len:518 (+),score=47.94 TRINITY_DN27110_c0_g1_i1:17-1570(+)
MFSWTRNRCCHLLFLILFDYPERLAFGIESIDVQNSPAPPREEVFLQFEYGRNWQRYLDNVLSDPPLSNVEMKQRLESMAEHLLDHFHISSFEGKTFIDVGCGSGLVSLAALALNATRVISFDYQIASVQTTRQLRTRVQDSAQFLRDTDVTSRWQILHGSILDEDFLATLPRADLVYSYGVLMTTGITEQALRNIARLVVDDGLVLFFVHAGETMKKSEQESWLSFKREYNSMTAWEKEEAGIAWVVSELAGPIQVCLNETEASSPGSTSTWFGHYSAVRFCLRERFQNFATRARGMDFLTDAHDWLGGYPYQWLFADEIISFNKHHVEPAMRIIRASFSALAGFLCTPKASGTQNYLVSGQPAGVWSGATLVPMEPDNMLSYDQFLLLYDVFLESKGGFGAPDHLRRIQEAGQGGACYVYILPPDQGEKCLDSTDRCISESSLVLQDMDLLGWGGDDGDGLFCQPHAGARYRILSTVILFSVEDGSDPRTNGHVYQLLKFTRCVGRYNSDTGQCM